MSPDRFLISVYYFHFYPSKKYVDVSTVFCGSADMFLSEEHDCTQKIFSSAEGILLYMLVLIQKYSISERNH